MERKIEVRAKVYTSRQGKVATDCMANVDIGGFIYLNSYKVMVTDKSEDRLIVLPPAYLNRTAKKWSPYIEFPDVQRNRLQKAIEDACISAYKVYEDTGTYQEYGETFTVDSEDLIADEPIGRFSSGGTIPTDVPDDFDMKEALNSINL